MSWTAGRSGRQPPSRARALWSADLVEAAKAAPRTIRIACRQEDHRALREEAGRIGSAEGCDVEVDMTTPRLVSVSFTRRGA